MVTYNDNTLGLNTVATHTCNPGYTLTTSINTRTCGAVTNNNDFTGVWLGTALMCEGIQNLLSAKEYHYLVMCIKLFVAIYFYAVVTITTCSDLPSIANGEPITYNMESMNNRSLGTMATYNCTSGYMLNGAASRQCQTGGKWSGNEPTCNCT